MTHTSYAIALLYALLPLQFALNPTADLDVPIIRLVLLAITLFFVATAFLKKSVFVPRGWVAGFFTAFAMWTFFSFFYSPILSWTMRKFIFLLNFFPLFYILTTIFVQKRTVMIAVIRYAVIGGVIASLIGSIQFLLQFIFSLNRSIYLWESITPLFLGKNLAESVSSYNSWLVHIGGFDIMRAIAFFPDPHIFSFHLGICMFLSLGLFFHKKNFLWLFAFLIILIADLLTFSRGGYAGLLAGCVVSIIIFWRHIPIRIKHISALIIFSSALIFFIPHNPVSERFLSSFSKTDTSVTHRLELWRQAQESIYERPFIGTGLGAYPYTVDPRASYRTPIYVHNLALDIFVELGLIGFLFFFGMILSAFWVLWKNRRSFAAYSAIMALSTFLFHSLFDTALFSVHVLPLLILLISIASYYENTSSR